MTESDDKEPGKISTARLVSWAIADAVGLYLVLSGSVGIVEKG